MLGAIASQEATEAAAAEAAAAAAERAERALEGGVADRGAGKGPEDSAVRDQQKWLRRRINALERLYSKVAPERAGTAATALETFAGRETELFERCRPSRCRP